MKKIQHLEPKTFNGWFSAGYNTWNFQKSKIDTTDISKQLNEVFFKMESAAKSILHLDVFIVISKPGILILRTQNQYFV